MKDCACYAKTFRSFPISEDKPPMVLSRRISVSYLHFRVLKLIYGGRIGGVETSERAIGVVHARDMNYCLRRKESNKNKNWINFLA